MKVREKVREESRQLAWPDHSRGSQGKAVQDPSARLAYFSPKEHRRNYPETSQIPWRRGLKARGHAMVTTWLRYTHICFMGRPFFLASAVCFAKAEDPFQQPPPHPHAISEVPSTVQTAVVGVFRVVLIVIQRKPTLAPQFEKRAGVNTFCSALLSLFRR